MGCGEGARGRGCGVWVGVWGLGVGLGGWVGGFGPKISQYVLRRSYCLNADHNCKWLMCAHGSKKCGTGPDRAHFG